MRRNSVRGERKMTRKFRFLPLLLLGLLLVPVLPSVSHAQVAVGISVRIGPPPLPVYAQPICPGPRYIWVPGYWAYGPDGYYWVPGTWVLAPRPGFLWTPGWWGFADGVYVWHRGYWGSHVGFYGGINYGFGYTGVGFVGGYWRGNEFFYNRAVTNVNVTVVRNVYVDPLSSATSQSIASASMVVAASKRAPLPKKCATNTSSTCTQRANRTSTVKKPRATATSGPPSITDVPLSPLRAARAILTVAIPCLLATLASTKTAATAIRTVQIAARRTATIAARVGKSPNIRVPRR